MTLVRPREESVGVIESPSERSARMTLFADLAAHKPLVVVAPVAAMRQYRRPAERPSPSVPSSCGSPRRSASRRCSCGCTALGYHRSDVVAAAGEFAVRGGIVDLWAASAAAPTRIEFFGDANRKLAQFRPRDAAQHRRARAHRDRAVERDPARASTSASASIARLEGSPGRSSAARAYVAARRRHPRSVAPARVRRAPHAPRLSRPERARRPRGAGDARDDRTRASTTSARVKSKSSSPASSRASSPSTKTLSAKRCWPTSSRRIRRSRSSRRRLPSGARSSSPAQSKARRCRGYRAALESFVARNAPGRTLQPPDRALLERRARAGSTAARPSRWSRRGASRLSEMLRGEGFTVERSASLLASARNRYGLVRRRPRRDDARRRRVRRPRKHRGGLLAPGIAAARARRP